MKFSRKFMLQVISDCEIVCRSFGIIYIWTSTECVSKGNVGWSAEIRGQSDNETLLSFEKHNDCWNW